MIDPMLRPHTPHPEDTAAVGTTWNAQAESPESQSDLTSLRAELERLRQRESQIMSLINCKHPDKLMHDLRNLLNELQLLRILVEAEKSS